MTIEKLAQKAREKGIKVSLKRRSDGGYVVKSINGHKYKGVEGNKVLRAIEGERLSAAQLAQRRGQYYNVSKEGRIKTRKTTSGEEVKSRKRKQYKEEISAPLKEQLKKTQRKWTKRKLFEKGQGRFTSESVRKAIRAEMKAGKTLEEAEASVMERLQRAEKYARGYANIESVEANINLLNKLSGAIKEPGLQTRLNNAIKYLEEHKEEIEEDKIKLINAVLYNDELTLEERASEVINVLSN